MLTFRPRLSSRQPMEAAARPLPREDTTPPVTKMYFADIWSSSSIVGGCARGARPIMPELRGNWNGRVAVLGLNLEEKPKNRGIGQHGSASRRVSILKRWAEMHSAKFRRIIEPICGRDSQSGSWSYSQASSCFPQLQGHSRERKPGRPNNQLPRKTTIPAKSSRFQTSHDG